MMRRCGSSRPAHPAGLGSSPRHNGESLPREAPRPPSYQALLLCLLIGIRLESVFASSHASTCFLRLSSIADRSPSEAAENPRAHMPIRDHPCRQVLGLLLCHAIDVE